MFRPALVAAVLLASSVEAQDASCAAREDIIRLLTENYGEELAGVGMYSPVSIFEVWSSDSTGTWTIVLSKANGMACIMASGTYWESRTNETEPQGELQ